jgi:hypothetical protein
MASIYDQNLSGTIGQDGTCTLAFKGPPIGYRLRITSGQVTTNYAGNPRVDIYRSLPTDTNRIASAQTARQKTFSGNGEPAMMPGEIPLVVFSGGLANGVVSVMLKGSLERF